MKLKHGYIQNTESIPSEYTGEGWIYFSEDDKAIYLDSGSGPVKFSGTEVDLSDYYTIEEVNNKIPSLEGYAKVEDIPSTDGFVTETWINNQGFITEHQSLDGLITKDEFDKVISEIPSLYWETW